MDLEIDWSSVWQEPVQEQEQPAGRGILVVPSFGFFVDTRRGRAKESGDEIKDIQSGLANGTHNTQQAHTYIQVGACAQVLVHSSSVGLDRHTA